MIRFAISVAIFLAALLLATRRRPAPALPWTDDLDADYLEVGW